MFQELTSSTPKQITRPERLITLCLLPLFLFALSFAARIWFFYGFILGDDSLEFGVNMVISQYGPNFGDNFQYRFTVWLFNVLFFKLFKISEFTFFLPTWLMSASLSPIGYFLLLRWGYRRREALLGGLLMATAPFEILLGTVRANDLILSWFLALSLLVFWFFEHRPKLQGELLAVLLWLAFYTKLWTIYFFPALGLYYLIRFFRYKEWRGAAAFTSRSFLLHSITAAFWKLKAGSYLPFLYAYSATYPYPKSDLPELFRVWPRMIFKGSEFGTTLFGVIPYFLVVLVLIKIIFSIKSIMEPTAMALDRIDKYLIVYYLSFFLLLNYFPTNFKFDQYYSVPRIFRYLGPISFPMVLHVAKMLLDLFRSLPTRVSVQPYLASAIFIPFFIVNLWQTDEATRPGKIYQKALFQVVSEIKKKCPPQLLAESWLAFFLNEIYLKDACPGLPIVPVPVLDPGWANEYEKWLDKTDSTLPEGTLLISGLGSYLHYGCHVCGFRLTQFSHPLPDHWKLVKEYDMLSYLPSPEPARLWRLSKGAEAALSTGTPP